MILSKPASDNATCRILLDKFCLFKHIVLVRIAKIPLLCVTVFSCRVHTDPGNPGKPGNVLEFCSVLEKVLEFFKNKDLSWKSPEKINSPLYFSSFVII